LLLRLPIRHRGDARYCRGSSRLVPSGCHNAPSAFSRRLNVAF
jgi:hypothetical protein